LIVRKPFGSWRIFTMKQRFAILAILSLCCVLGTASASVIGTLLTGSSGTITVSDTGITWNPDSAALPTTTCFGKPCNGDVATGTTLTFAGCPVNCLITQEGILIDNGNMLTPSTLIPEVGFLQFESHPLLQFRLDSIGTPGVNEAALTTACATLALGASCVPFIGSPVVLTLTATGTSAHIDLFGMATDDGGATYASNWSGSFSAPITGKTPGQIELEFCSSNTTNGQLGSACNTTATESSSNSGTFLATATPEPGSFMLIGGGLIGVAALSRRRKKA
jgi:hypothetical protein